MPRGRNYDTNNGCYHTGFVFPQVLFSHRFSFPQPGFDDLGRAGIPKSRETAGFDPDIVHTSCLNRSIKSAWYISEEVDALFVPVCKTWRLNQRFNGSLQGLPKEETAKQVGADAVAAWRNSLKERTPSAATLRRPVSSRS